MREYDMKKLLVSVVFLLMLMWVKGAKNVQAAVSDNFTKIVLNDGRSEKVESGQLVHVNVELTGYQKDKLKSDDSLTITWSESDKVQAKGINKTKNIIIKDENDNEQKVGTYTVETNRVLVKFNNKIEKYDHLVGQLTFDLLVRNSANDKQEGNTQFVPEIESLFNVIEQNYKYKETKVEKKQA